MGIGEKITWLTGPEEDWSKRCDNDNKDDVSPNVNNVSIVNIFFVN